MSLGQQQNPYLSGMWPYNTYSAGPSWAAAAYARCACIACTPTSMALSCISCSAHTKSRQCACLSPVVDNAAFAAALVMMTSSRLRSSRVASPVYTCEEQDSERDRADKTNCSLAASAGWGSSNRGSPERGRGSR